MKRILLSFILLFIITGAFAQIQTAGSYLNVSRPNGGPIQSGDILEIRAVIAVPSGTTVTAARFTDNVPTGTVYRANSISVLTNEGVAVPAITNTGNYTDATGDDRGQYVAGAVTVYIGDGATSAAGGSINGSSTLPRHYGNACILMVAYRVTVSVTNGSSISLTGAFHYTSGTVQNINLPANPLKVAPLVGCISPALSNLNTAETNGTFGSGTTLNRSTASSNITGFSFQNLTSGAPGDGQYSIAKNTSYTQYTGASPASSDRVFGVWDVFGDHSGTNTAAGNAPSANGANGGYMAVVNASYAPAAVFNVPIVGLTTNSSYTISFWLRNICATCGNNPAANAGSGTPGVKPNLAFELDGIDLYSTGEIAYTGQWVQKAFTFNSGSVSSFTLSIKNNAPGGGGNDWAIDDIKVAQCFIVLPVKLVSFTATKEGKSVILKWETAEEVNLSYFSIEKSTDGSNFTAIGNVSRNSNGNGKYQFVDKSNADGKMYYRLRVVDQDDKATWSKTLLVSGSELVNKMLVVPNPVRNEAVLNIETTVKGNAIIKVFNADGRQVLQQASTLTEGANQLNIAGAGKLNNGIYLIQSTIAGTILTTRMIVTK